MTDRKLIATLQRARGWLALTANEVGRPRSSDIHRVMAEIDAIIAQGTPTRQRQDRNGLGPKDGGPVPAGDAPETSSSGD